MVSKLMKLNNKNINYYDLTKNALNLLGNSLKSFKIKLSKALHFYSPFGEYPNSPHRHNRCAKCAVHKNFPLVIFINECYSNIFYIVN